MPKISNATRLHLLAQSWRLLGAVAAVWTGTPILWAFWLLGAILANLCFWPLCVDVLRWVEHFDSDPLGPGLWVTLGWLWLANLLRMTMGFAVVAVVNARLEGEEPQAADAFWAVVEHLWPIAVLSLTHSLVVAALDALSRRFHWLGDLLTAVLGQLWGLATSLVVPALLLSPGMTTLAALKESLRVTHATWGESLLTRATLKWALVFLGTPLLIAAWVLWLWGSRLLWPQLSVQVLFFGCMAVVWAFWLTAGMLEEILNLVLYRYARMGQVSGDFAELDLRHAFLCRPGPAI